MRRVLQIWLLVFGLACVGIALAHLFFGTASIIGAGPVNATIDSDMRFYAVVFGAYGMAVAWCARDVEQKGPAINSLGAVFFAGGLARLLAWVVSGEPNWFYVLMTPVELLIPILNYFLVRAVCVDHASNDGRACIIQSGPIRNSHSITAALPFELELQLDGSDRPKRVRVVDVFTVNEEGLVTSMKAYWSPEDIQEI